MTFKPLQKILKYIDLNIINYFVITSVDYLTVIETIVVTAINQNRYLDMRIFSNDLSTNKSNNSIYEFNFSSKAEFYY